VAEIAGKKKEWDSEITRQVRDSEIDWVGFGDPDNRSRRHSPPDTKGEAT
jgi:hypothetical protein